MLRLIAMRGRLSPAKPSRAAARVVLASGMRRILLIVALLLGPAETWAKPPAKGQKPAAARSAKPAPAAAGKSAKPAAPTGPFDARDPASLIALVASMDAKASVSERSETDVKLTVTTPYYSFGAQYVDCAPSGRGCQGVAFSTSSDKQRVTLAQINSFNQTSISCRAFMDKAGAPHIVYATLVFPSDTRDDMRLHLGAWQGCLASFGAFLQDPNGYLAAAP
jgi:hypothetical protein